MRTEGLLWVPAKQREGELRDNWRKEKKNFKRLPSNSRLLTSSEIAAPVAVYTHTSFTCYWDQTPKQRENGEWKQKNPRGEREHTEYGRSHVHTITTREAEQSSTIRTYVKFPIGNPFWWIPHSLQTCSKESSASYPNVFVAISFAFSSSHKSSRFGRLFRVGWRFKLQERNLKAHAFIFHISCQNLWNQVHGEHSFGRHSTIICDNKPRF